MRLINIIIAILVISAFFAGPVYANDKMDKQEIKILREKKETSKEVDLDRIIEALNLIVRYQHWREDQRAIQKALERRYDIKKDVDPFAFKSERLRELIEKDRVSKEEFEQAIEEIEAALKELKDYYYEK